jgi:hypothetical protein
MTTPKAAMPIPASAADRTAWLVLGMHRSGTSAVTRLLALAGCDLPENLVPEDEHNARGYFEPWKIAVLNDERLRAAGSAWDDVFVHPFRPLGRREERGWLNRAVELFEAEYGDVRQPLLKDPRVSVLMPLWREALGDLEFAVRCVIPVRHPLAVAGSLARRDGFSPEKSVLLWTAYMLAAEAGSRDLPRAFVSYDALLADWRAAARRLAKAVGPFPRRLEDSADEIDGFLSPDLRHNAGDGDLATLGWTGELAGAVLAWFEAAASGKAPHRAPLDAATAELERRRAEIGPLVSPAARDLDAARVKLEDAERLVAIERGWAAEREQGIRDVFAAREAELLGTLSEARAAGQKAEAEVQRLQSELASLRARWEEVGARLDTLLADS